jgi:diguanylate cyclase (GGDEF)-like protein
MPGQQSEASGLRSAIAMLVMAAAGVVLFTAAAGLLAYLNTQRLITSANWVQHTQDVLSSLQRASLLNERVEYRTQLYEMGGDESNLERARTSVNLLATSVAHIRSLVDDNPEQVRSAQDLAAATDELTRALNGFNRQSPIPVRQVQRFQQIIALMTDREQLLLHDRDLRTQRRSFTSIWTEIAAVCVFLLIQVVLFGLLMRDAVQRQRTDERTMLTNRHLENSVKALKDRASESVLLNAARDEIQLCVEVAQVYSSAARSIARLLPGTRGAIAMINNSRQMVERVSTWGEPAINDFAPPEACCGLRSGQPRWRQPGFSEIHCTHFDSKTPERYLCKPIVAHGETLGVVYVECEDDAVIEAVKDVYDGFRQLVQITGMSIATLNLQARLEHQSVRDSLTGLFNRHFMEIFLERELSRAARRKQVLAVIMLDVDHFKKFNDTYGHTAGDTALKEIAAIFQSNIRAEDVACRYGGEEFAILLPDISMTIAAERAEKILRAVANLRVTVGAETYDEFSVSIGIAYFPSDGESSEVLLRKADEALYRSKRQGRNRISLYEQVPLER